MHNKTFKIKLIKVFPFIAFAFFFLITCYKLTYAPLWFDETIEFWYSKNLNGYVPYEMQNGGQASSMYQRIVSTYQPPLYNIVMFFWLKISTAEWWFRFFSVLMGFVGNLAIYKTVKKLSNTI